MAVQEMQSLSEELSCILDLRLLEDLRETQNILSSAAKNGFNHWVLAFSGGKDSSLVALLVTEMIKRRSIKDVEVDVVFSDTLMELPPFGENATALLSHITDVSAEHELPIRTHTVTPPVDQRFWFLIIGKGYPPPHNHFRWCTDRLKILPSKRVMKNIVGTGSTVLTGVRFGESDNRDSRLKVGMCSKDDSECGQGVWLNGDSKIGIPGLAPIAHWRTCKVWDFLMMADGLWGWPFKSLSRMYGDSPATRFGCWMCTLVKEDKALKAVTANAEWAHLTDLHTIRQKLLDEGRQDKNRIKQPNGALGRTSISFRREMLDDLIGLEKQLSTTLISAEEVEAIRAYWDVEQTVGNPYTSECKFWKWKSKTTDA